MYKYGGVKIDDFKKSILTPAPFFELRLPRFGDSLGMGWHPSHHLPCRRPNITVLSNFLSITPVGMIFSGNRPDKEDMWCITDNTISSLSWPTDSWRNVPSKIMDKSIFTSFAIKPRFPQQLDIPPLLTTSTSSQRHGLRPLQKGQLGLFGAAM